MPAIIGSIETSTISCTNCLSTFSMSRRERNVRVQEVQLDASWLHQSPLHRPSSSKKQLQLSSSIVINVKARAGARLRRSVDPMQQFVCLPYQLMRSAPLPEPRDVLIRHAGRCRMQGGAVGIGRAGRGRTECRHWTEDRGSGFVVVVADGRPGRPASPPRGRSGWQRRGGPSGGASGGADIL